MFRLYKVIYDSEGKEKGSVDEYTDVITAEGAFEFQKGLAMENKSFAFLMLLDSNGKIHSDAYYGYIATIGEGTITPRLIEFKTKATEAIKSYLHEDVYDASADFYKRLGGAKQDAEVKSEMLRVIDENGNPHEYTYWVRPIEIPTE